MLWLTFKLTQQITVRAFLWLKTNNTAHFRGRKNDSELASTLNHALYLMHKLLYTFYIYVLQAKYPKKIHLRLVDLRPKHIWVLQFTFKRLKLDNSVMNYAPQSAKSSCRLRSTMPKQNRQLGVCKTSYQSQCTGVERYWRFNCIQIKLNFLQRMIISFCGYWNKIQ